jgi:hypothetical protein
MTARFPARKKTCGIPQVLFAILAGTASRLYLTVRTNIVDCADAVTPLLYCAVTLIL